LTQINLHASLPPDFVGAQTSRRFRGNAPIEAAAAFETFFFIAEVPSLQIAAMSGRRA
jgi:hypothetical protein